MRSEYIRDILQLVSFALEVIGFSLAFLDAFFPEVAKQLGEWLHRAREHRTWRMVGSELWTAIKTSLKFVFAGFVSLFILGTVGKSLPSSIQTIAALAVGLFSLYAAARILLSAISVILLSYETLFSVSVTLSRGRHFAALGFAIALTGMAIGATHAHHAAGHSWAGIKAYFANRRVSHAEAPPSAGATISPRENGVAGH